MSLRDLWSRIVLWRRIVRDLDRLATAQEEQTQLIKRLVDRIAPIVEEPSVADLKRFTGVDSISYVEQGRIQDFTDRCLKDLGREPTEEEIVAFLDGQEQSL